MCYSETTPVERCSHVDLSLLLGWLIEAGRIALSLWCERKIATKPDGSVTTNADSMIEEYLLKCIETHYPGHAILSEEDFDSRRSVTSGSEFVWIIDPIDGSRMYSEKLPIWAISVGVVYRNQPYVGALYLPAIQEMYWGSDEGAYWRFGDNEPERILANTGDMEFDNSENTFLAAPARAHREYSMLFERVHCFGSTAVHLAYVARGIAIGALTRHVSIWDIAGAMPILNKTNVELSYLSGEAFHLSHIIDGSRSREPLVVAHSSMIDRVREHIRRLPPSVG